MDKGKVSEQGYTRKEYQSMNRKKRQLFAGIIVVILVVAMIIPMLAYVL